MDWHSGRGGLSHLAAGVQPTPSKEEEERTGGRLPLTTLRGSPYDPPPPASLGWKAPCFPVGGVGERGLGLLPGFSLAPRACQVTSGPSPRGRARRRNNSHDATAEPRYSEALSSGAEAPGRPGCPAHLLSCPAERGRCPARLLSSCLPAFLSSFGRGQGPELDPEAWAGLPSGVGRPLPAWPGRAKEPKPNRRSQKLRGLPGRGLQQWLLPGAPLPGAAASPPAKLRADGAASPAAASLAPPLCCALEIRRFPFPSSLPPPALLLSFILLLP